MNRQDTLAIVGYSYRAPGVGRKGLWEFLLEAKSAWSHVPKDRFNHSAHYHPRATKPGFISSAGGHFLPGDIYAFDPVFFNIKEDEARLMDPQHRLVLECAFEAAENAGLTLPQLMGASVGVFAATDFSEHSLQTFEDTATTSQYLAVGTMAAMTANRVSYFFGLTGPSVATDAACAGGSYAVHMACQSVLSGECSAAFVGGARLLNGTVEWCALNAIGTLSPEGRCFSYDSKGSGFGRGEGGACIIIKKLSDAIACGDPVRAVIRNTACNHSGRSQGITMPSRSAQEALLIRIHHDIGLDPAETTFIEGHGTGTRAGDPVDAGAILSVVGKSRTPSNPVYIGSIKSNIGHLEGTSGLISIVKSIMMLEHEMLLPNAGFEALNPSIEGGERLRVLKEARPWPPRSERRICVTNFGFGGSNAAILLEQAPSGRRSCIYGNENESTAKALYGTVNDVVRTSNGAAEALRNGPSNDRSGMTVFGTARNGPFGEYLFVFSAKSRLSLEAYLPSMANFLESAPQSNNFVRDLAFTLGQRRTHFPHRIAVVANSITSLRKELLSIPAGIKPGVTKCPVVAFTFTGQGAQYFQMGEGLKSYPVFAKALQDAEQILSQLGATWMLSEELAKGEHESRVHDTDISQPACTTIQLALVLLLQSWGVKPAVVIGHSSGEIAASFAAGLVSFDAAVAIAYFRGVAAMTLSRDMAIKGSMLALGTGVEEATRLIESQGGYATIAAINGPANVTISGDVPAIDSIQEQAEAQGTFARRLNVGVPYHSRHMERVASSYMASIESLLALGSPPFMDKQEQPRFISTVSGREELLDVTDASYWVKNLVRPVLFLDAVERLLCDGGTEGINPDILIEIGPHPALQNTTKKMLECAGQVSGDNRIQTSYLPSLIRNKDASVAMLELAANVFALGIDVAFENINLTKDMGTVISDLPPYEWNKTTRYIHRSRVTTQKLHGGKPFNTLLGFKSPYDEGDEQTFRNVFTLDDMPWLRDHIVADDILFPCTGFIALAFEGLKAMSSNPPSAFFLREFHVLRSLRLEEEKRVDISTKFKPMATGTETLSESTWTFEVMSWFHDDGWTSHARGIIEADNSESLLDIPTGDTAIEALNDDRLQHLDAQREYERASDNGINYGPSFRNIVAIRHTPSLAVLTVRLPRLDARNISQSSGATVDPPFLDCMAQTVGLLQGTDGPRAVLVPTFIGSFRISNMIDSTAGREFCAVNRLITYERASGMMRVSVVLLDMSTKPPTPIAEMRDLTLKAILKPNDSHLIQSLPDTFKVVHAPFVDLINGRTLAKMIQGEAADETELQHRRRLDRAGLLFLNQFVQETIGDDTKCLPSHLSKFLAWARNMVARQSSGMPSGFQHAPVPPDLVATVSSENSAGEMLCKVGGQLTDIVRGRKQALDIMLEGGLLTRNYEEDVSNKRGNLVLSRFVARLAECNSDLNILEIGAGTGGASLPVLEAIQRVMTTAGASLFQYTFTDISSGFFENARIKLSHWSRRVKYVKLDISQDPISQGFDAEAYDLIIASNVLHATADIMTTMKNVNRLLKPRGKLAMVELVKEMSPAALPFALLPGWWLSEDSYRSRAVGPTMSKGDWDDALQANGFSGVDGFVDDYPEMPEHTGSVLWSTKCNTQVQGETSVVIYKCTDDEECATFATALSEILGGPATIKSLLEFSSSDNASLSIYIEGTHRSIMSDMPRDQFHVLQYVLTRGQNLLWILPEDVHPDADTIKGILQTLRLEGSSNTFFLLERTPLDSIGARAVADLVQWIQTSGSTRLEDQNFAVIDGLLHVSRFRTCPAAKDVFAREAGMSIKKEQKVLQDNIALQMTMESAGSLDSFYFRRTNILEEDIGEDEVDVRVEAVGINFRDLLLVLGSLPWEAPGCEGAGVVVRTGSLVDNVRVGDRIIYLAVHGGGFANFVRVKNLHVHKMPNSLSMVEAATLPVAYITAIHSIMEVSRLQPGETILIHSASGAVGQACIRLAQHVGAQVFATAGTQEKREFLTQTFSLPESQVFSSRTSTFKNSILKATSGYGVDVIVNQLSGNLLQDTWSLIAEHGRFIELGKKDFLKNNYLPMRPFLKNVIFAGVNLDQLWKGRARSVRNSLSTVVRMAEAGIITPIQPTTVLPISQLQAGLRKLQGGHNKGKIIITIDPNDTVLADQAPLLQASVRPNATYLITGGTGSIGRALATRMINKGAKNIVLLGRSGSTNPKVAELLRQYDKTNVCIRALACDVGSPSELSDMAESIKDLPRVRGVVHGALYLRDAMFINATYDDWQRIRAPKVQAAWKLHDLYPELDFFVILSSATAVIGHAGQSVYAGASTCLDAFAEYRSNRGQPTVSISLPAVEGVGYVAERGIGEQLKRTLGLALTEAQLYSLFDGAILGPESGLNINGHGFSRVYWPTLDGVPRPWERFNHLSALRGASNEPRGSTPIINTGSASCNRRSIDTPESLMEALKTRVSAMTMIDKDEITADRRLTDYGLDSLVSSELHNWIERETGVDLALKEIMAARDLDALAKQILARMKIR